jgi:hypothetical protein
MARGFPATQLINREDFREMLSTFQTRFGVPGIIAVIALVFATVGGAFAASGPLASSSKAHHSKGLTKGQVIALIKKLGTSGPAGPTGAQGPKGDPGPQGAPGTPGKDGTFGTKPLPSKQSLSGTWATSGGVDTNGATTFKDVSQAAISFSTRVSPTPIALYETKFGPFSVGVVLEDESAPLWKVPTLDQQGVEEGHKAFEEDCPGSASAPQAAPGFLCIYPDQSRALGQVGGPDQVSTTHPALLEPANSFGLVVPFEIEDEEAALRGSWAVTAE